MDKELIILAFYIDISGLTRKQTDQKLYQFMSMGEDMFTDVNKDVKVYYLPSDKTSIDCIYPPSIIGENKAIENEMLKIYKLIAESKDGEAKDMMVNIERKLKLKNIINEIKNEKDA